MRRRVIKGVVNGLAIVMIFWSLGRLFGQAELLLPYLLSFVLTVVIVLTTAGLKADR